MATLNKVQLIGNLGRDPELRRTPQGMAVCTVSLATTNAWNDKGSGGRVEETEWHRVTFYGRLGEIVGEHLTKGRPVYVEGRLRTRKWQDKEGRDAFSTEIVASDMQMLGTKPDEERVPSRRTGRVAPDAPAADDDIPVLTGGGGLWLAPEPTFRHFSFDSY